jgi:imidazolonepropionase-like amidohydrolase
MKNRTHGGGIVSDDAGDPRGRRATLVAQALPRLDALPRRVTTIEIKSGYACR